MPSEELRVRSARVPLTVTVVGADGETDTQARYGGGVFSADSFVRIAYRSLGGVR